MKDRILFVDDDPNILEAYQRKLQHVLLVRTAEGPHTGLRELKEKGPFAVVIADMNMPLMNGVEFLEKVREIAPETVRMMLTGNTDVKVAMQAVNDGNVFRFLTKPCPSKLMGESLIAGIKQYRLVTAEKELLEGTLKGTVELLAEILSWVNPDAFGRTLQLRNTAMAIASNLKAVDTWEIELAATLSQIGTMAIPQDLFAKLSRGDPLGEDEQQVLASVPAVGQELLKRIPRLENVARIVLYQNKHYDGGGFPEDTVAEKDIPLGARILKIANDFHELRASGESRREALKQMNDREGWYDPSILPAVGTAEQPRKVQGESPKVVPLSLKELRAGLKLASDVTTSEDRKLVAAGTVISEALLIRLRKFHEVKGVTEPIEVLIHTSA
ncbi:MAG: response regulator [Nitrospiraceae bacterium]|nr:response regulator [Nitrospiraceae bacterium]